MSIFFLQSLASLLGKYSLSLMHPDALCLSKVYSLSFHIEGDIIYLDYKKSLLFDRKLLTSVQFRRDNSSHQEAKRNKANLYLYALCFFKSKPSYIKGH